MTFLVVLVAGLVFAALRWGLSRLAAPAFVVDAASFAVAALVLVSNGLLGIKL